MRSSQSVDNRERVLLVGVGLKKTPRGRTSNPGAVGRENFGDGLGHAALSLLCGVAVIAQSSRRQSTTAHR